jgi:hypothetical protein
VSAAEVSHGYSENGVRTKPTFVGRAVQLDQHLVQVRLGRQFSSNHLGSDLGFNSGGCGEHALAPVPGFVAIPALQGLVLASRFPRRHRGSCSLTSGLHADFQGRKAPGVQDFQSGDAFDAHGWLLEVSDA